MSLRIRRGTDAQRLQITPDEGELIYTTNTKKLFIGDGIVAGGINIGSTLAGTGLVFDTGTQTLQVTSVPGGSGIASVSADLNPALGGNLNLNGKNVTGTGTIGIVGTMYASQGLGGDLALNTHNINGTGNISITGNLSVTGLGADLNLNTKNITGTGNITTSGTLSVTGLGADLSLNGHNINGTGNITTNGNITATNIGNSNLTITSNTINTSTTSLIFANSNLSVITLQGLTDGNASGVSGIEMHTSRGTIASPLTTQANDIIGRITLSGWNGIENKSASTLYASWAANAVLTDTSPASNLIFYVGAGGSATKTAIFTSVGVFSAPVLKTGSYDGSVNYPPVLSNPTAAAGIIIFDSATNHFLGWNGTAWKQLDN
jgi:hypothetical protein